MPKAKPLIMLKQLEPGPAILRKALPGYSADMPGWETLLQASVANRVLEREYRPAAEPLVNMSLKPALEHRPTARSFTTAEPAITLFPLYQAKQCLIRFRWHNRIPKMDNDCIDIVSVKASFVGAALYKIGDNLISYSALLNGSHLFARIVVDNAIPPSEEDLLYDILGGIVGDFGEMVADFELMKVESTSAASDIELLPIQLFHRAV